jgi:hypothetical protein
MALLVSARERELWHEQEPAARFLEAPVHPSFGLGKTR